MNTENWKNIVNKKKIHAKVYNKKMYYFNSCISKIK